MIGVMVRLPTDLFDPLTGLANRPTGVTGCLTGVTDREPRPLPGEDQEGGIADTLVICGTSFSIAL